VLAGEALGPLRDGAGAATPVRLVVTGGFRVGGAAAPSTAGAFIASTPDEPAGLRLEGLAPGMDYDVTITVVTAPGSLGGVGQVKVIDASPPRFAEIAPSTPSALVMLPATADRWGAVTLDFQPPEGDGLAISQLAITGR